jgi:hypothetical protein
MALYHRENFPVKEEAAERHRSVAQRRKIVIATPWKAGEAISSSWDGHLARH